MTNGFSMVEFMELPALERCLVRLLLRKQTLNTTQLREALTHLPAGQRMSESQLNATLDALVRDHWLTREGSGAQARYRVSALPRMLRHPAGIWDTLEPDTIQPPYTQSLCRELGQTTSPLTSGGKRRLPANLWKRLAD